MKAKSLIILLMIAAATATVCSSRTLDTASISETDRFKIEFINSKSSRIKIGGKNLKVGGEFIANETIDWNDDSEYIKATNLRTGEHIRFCAPGFKDKKAESLCRWFFLWRKTISKGLPSVDMKDFLSQTHYMMDDTLYLYSSLKQDGVNKYYRAKVVSKDTSSNNSREYFPLPFDDMTKQIVITRSYLNDQKIDITKSAVTLMVDYLDGSEWNNITNNLIIEYLPKIR